MSEGYFRTAGILQVRKVGFCPVKSRGVLGREAAVGGSTCDWELSRSLSLPLGSKAGYLLMETDEAGALEIMS